MTPNEFAYFTAALKTYFPKDNLLPTPEAASLWYEMLKDLDGNVLMSTLKKWVATEKWPPSIAELRERCAEVVHGKLPDWGEGWAEVTEAVRRYGYMQESRALASMSPTTQAAVRKIGWSDICTSENPETLRAQFRMIYEITEKREAEQRQIPESVRGVLEGIAAKMLPE